MGKAQAEDYLTSLLNKNLRIHTTDARIFLGTFKCTDSDRNIILSQTFEYRLPPPPKPLSDPPSQTTTKIDLTSRYLGLVVVPGAYINKIEVEEFASQVKGSDKLIVRRGLSQGLGGLEGRRDEGGIMPAGGVETRR